MSRACLDKTLIFYEESGKEKAFLTSISIMSLQRKRRFGSPSGAATCGKHAFPLNFPYLCSQLVLVNSSFVA
jgi:hypothetical protein